MGRNKYPVPVWIISKIPCELSRCSSGIACVFDVKLREKRKTRKKRGEFTEEFEPRAKKSLTIGFKDQLNTMIIDEDCSLK